ncbi:phenylacetate--CoA ligase family protein [Hydrogenimonas urashimensis]|uniref:phenylacetate--CoA ligase family protein n=1 Tax=Hydrogenimonas urashimensis TaxID=2740515 RepID=UPI0019162912|nr:phenylacetate--CoA ligase family protein [Hydrogenimonas urashimensis]
MSIQKFICFLRSNISINQKHILEYFHNLKNDCSMPIEILEKKQIDQLNILLNHAYKNVPYYSKIFKDLGLVQRGVVELKDLSELKNFPFLTKEIIRQQKENLYSKDLNKRNHYVNTSGGSTGEPVKFLQCDKYKLSNKANFELVKFLRGCTPYDSTIIIWGADRDIAIGKRSLKDRFLDFQLNRVCLNSYKLSENDMINFLKILNKRPPKLIISYIQSIYELAKFAKENKIYVEKQNAIHTSAGTVYDYMRDLIEDVFQCKIFNHYGSREVGPIATECSAHDGLHIMMEHTIVEVVNEKGELCKPGEEGEIVVTSLHNFAMPLIRYKIGDIGIFQEYTHCSCGCSYPKLHKVLGRSTDFFINTKDEKIYGAYFTHIFYFRNWIEKFQVIQKTKDKILIKIVKKDKIPKNELDDIVKKIKFLMGDECEVNFEFVKDIPKTETGKFLYTISKIPN